MGKKKGRVDKGNSTTPRIGFDIDTRVSTAGIQNPVTSDVIVNVDIVGPTHKIQFIEPMKTKNKLVAQQVFQPSRYASVATTIEDADAFIASANELAMNKKKPKKMMHLFQFFSPR